MGEFESVDTPSKKRKKKIEVDADDVPEKKSKTFCCRTFRQELKGSEALKSLKRFISAAKNSDDVIFEYLDNGGSLQEILSLIDVTAMGDLTTALPVFEVVHLILLRFRSVETKQQQFIDSARTILRSHMITIKAMLSMNITKQKKIALKVLTAIATLDSSFANEIMNVVALSPALITDLIQPSPEKESVRKCFILFVLSFLVEGNLVIVKNLLDKKGFLGSIIPGLKFDEATTVNLTLSLFEDKILKNVKIPKTLKLKLFNTQIIKSLFDLYDWKGLQGVKQILPKKKNKVKEVEIVHSEKEMVIESVHSFLMLLCCSQKFGVAFYDKSMGTSEQLNNQLLLTVFESLADPLKNKKMAELVLKTTASCPDIMKPLLLKLEPSFQPRNSKNWFNAMEFAEDLIKAMDATSILKTEDGSLTASQIAKVGKTLCAPLVFLRVIKLGAEKSQPMEIRFRSLRLLTTIWREMEKLSKTFVTFQDDLKKSLHKHILNSLPDALDMVYLWHTLCDAEFFSSLPLSPGKKIEFLSAVLDSLHIIVECQNDAVASPLSLTSDLLHHVEMIKDNIGKELEDIQVKIVQFVEIDLEGLTPQMELFEKSLVILLRSTEETSLSNLSKILESLEVFNRNKAEVDVWILCLSSLPREFRPLVGSFLIESIRRSLNENVKGELMKYLETNVSTDDDVPKASKESITPLLFQCVEVLKLYTSELSKKDEKLLACRHFLNDLVIHLQHFYTVDVYLYDHFKDVGKILSKSCLNYLKNWKNNCFKSVEADAFPSAVELNLVSWLISDSSGSVQDVIRLENVNLLQLYSLFRIVVAYFIKRTIDGCVMEGEVEKFIEAFSLFLCYPPEDEGDRVDLISNSLNPKPTYQRRCLECLFSNAYLLKGFDVFQKGNKNFVTSVLFEIFIARKTVKKVQVKNKLSKDWKFRFLKQLKGKLKKGKPIEGYVMLERVLDYFQYDHEEVEELVEMLMAATDLNLFVNGEKPSDWVVILSKFIKMHCQKEELNGDVVRNLCVIMKHLSENCTSDLEQFTDCFVYLIRKHPSHLLIIENDFLDVILLSVKDSTLGKLLLNDPGKVKYLFKFIKKNLENLEEPDIFISLLSSLIVEENSYFGEIGDSRGVWKMSEICGGKTPEFYEILEIFYKKFEKNILKAITGDDEVFLKNLEFTRKLVELFLDGKKLSKMKKEILKGKFEPELAFEVVKKLNESAVTEQYVQGLLVLFLHVIKNSKEANCWPRYCSLVSDLIEFNKELNWENMAGSSEWKEFAKLSLGYCLGSMKHSSLLKILRLFFSKFNKSNEAKDCGLFFQMLISHSQFLRVILSDSPLKFELVELFRSLIEKSPSEMSPKHFPILLASYTASLSPSDQTILKVLRFYEENGVGVSDYEPFVWGETGVSHYSIGTNPGLSLWQRFNMGNVLDLLDNHRLELSLKEFPIRRSLNETDNPTVYWNTNVYDPAFLLPLFVNLLSPGSVVFCLSFIYKGGLAYTVRALSSECKDVRLIASTVLTRFYNHLESSQNLKQKLVWMHFINCFRYGIEDLTVQPLPNISTLFFARMTLELSRQPAELFLPLQNFLLAKFYFSFDAVPEFLPLFHSSEMSYWKHREWLLEVIRDGTKTTADINIIFHSMAPKIIFCFFSSQLCDTETKKLILQVVERMLRVDKSILLISEYGLLNWITSIDSDCFPSILNDLLNLLSTVVGVIVKDIQYNKIKHSNSSNLIQVLNMAVKILPSLKSRKSVEGFKIYLKLINDCFMYYIKDGESDWFKLNKSRLTEIVDAGVVFGEEWDCVKYRKVPFYFRDFDEGCCCEDLKKYVFLFNLLANMNDGIKNK